MDVAALFHNKLTFGRRRLWTLRRKGTIIAFLICCLFAAVFVSLKAGYDCLMKVNLPSVLDRVFSYVLDQTDVDTCQLLLDGVADRKTLFRTACKQHSYNSSDVNECLRRSFERTNRQNYITFLGDSRIREQFRYFGQMLGSEKDDFLEYVDDRYKLRLRLLEFYSPMDHTFLESLNGLLNTSLAERPRFLAMSSALWDIMLSWPHLDRGLQNFTDILFASLPLLQKLSETTEIIWILQAPVAEAVPGSKFSTIHRNRKRCCHGCCNTEEWLRSSEVTRYNDAARRILSNSTVRIWKGYRSTGHRYAFDLLDGVHLRNGPRTVTPRVEKSYVRKLSRHPDKVAYMSERIVRQTIRNPRSRQSWLSISRALFDRSQVILNFYCNRYMFQSDDNRFCCTRPREKTSTALEEDD